MIALFLYLEGMEMPFISEIEVVELDALLARGEDGDAIQLLDVRSNADIVRGGIPTASPIPLQMLPLKLHTLSKHKPVILYCQIGLRSTQAGVYLEAQGFNEVLCLRGGFQAWSQSGLRVA